MQAYCLRFLSSRCLDHARRRFVHTYSSHKTPFCYCYSGAVALKPRDWGKHVDVVRLVPDENISLPQLFLSCSSPPMLRAHIEQPQDALLLLLQQRSGTQAVRLGQAH